MVTLSRRQKSIIWVGVAAIVVLAVYVPWSEGIHSYARGYSLIFRPPDAYSHLDTTRVVIPMGVVTLLTGALVFVGPSWKFKRFWNRPQKPSPLPPQIRTVTNDAAGGLALFGFVAFACIVIIGLAVIFGNSPSRASGDLIRGPTPSNSPRLVTNPNGRNVPLSQWTNEELTTARDQLIAEEAKSGGR